MPLEGTVVGETEAVRVRAWGGTGWTMRVVLAFWISEDDPVHVAVTVRVMVLLAPVVLAGAV